MIAVGLFLRMENAESRILHSDEAVQAYQLWQLMETGEYRYDPQDKHGPLLYYLTSAVNRVSGISSSELDRITIRIVPFISSIAILTLMLAAPRKKGGTTLIAAALFAISPLPVIYGAYFVQEALFTLIGFLALYALDDYVRKPNPLPGAFVGLSLAAFFATKETAIIHTFAISVAVWASNPEVRNAVSLKQAMAPRNIGLAIVAFILLWVIFFSNAFHDFNQLADSVRTFASYAERSQGAGHEKPFHYYLSLFWPRIAEGIRWGEAPVLILSGIGFALAIIRSREFDRRIRVAIHYGFSCLVLYSIIPYKTPWLMLSVYVSMAYAAAIAFAFMFRWRAALWARLAVAGVLVYCAAGQYNSTKLANRYAADARNPYIYQHTSPQFQKLVDRISQLEALDPDSRLSIAVGGEDNAWPLPWYLRENDTVGFWQNPLQTPALDVVIGPAGALPPTLAGTHVVEYHGLRENVILECWIRQELWSAFMETR